MTITELRTNWEWSNTKSDMVDRVTRAIFDQLSDIEACNGKLKPHTVISWCGYCEDAPLWHGNFSFRCGVSDVPNGESVLATPTS